MSQRQHGPGRAATAPAPEPRPQATAAYLPRNVVNAPELKSAIAARSTARGDDAPVQAWLGNHFFRWLIGSFEHAVAIRSLQHYTELLGPSAEVPAWFVKQCAAAPASGFYIDPQHPFLLDRERLLVEFLNARRGTRLAEKLQRITCPMAFEMWDKEHARMQARRGKGWVPSSGRALRHCLRTPNGVVFEFVPDNEHLREEMAYESFHMQHCLGQFADKKRLSGGYGEQYASSAQKGSLRLFTLRDGSNQPHVTLSLHVNGDSLSIDQIKGKQNRHPVHKYVADVLQFLRWLGVTAERHADCDGMGLVYEKRGDGSGEWKFVTELGDPDLLLSVICSTPHLAEHFEHPPAAFQWLMLSINPSYLARLKNVDPAVAAAAGIAKPDSPPVLGDTLPAPRWLEHWRGDGVPDGDTLYQVEGIPIGHGPRWLSRLFGA